ncbi:hypothetical protein B0H17DRAFT_1130559 [Mycena rosella]|uniref:Secreted protein n=1 Tax=Mycena rosella TaxID=1033263 RepID=A0AAD7DSI2_MYCRO|nr:hypothetical protein B0H17DRAFT_1130559 [Mycena rosella]
MKFSVTLFALVPLVAARLPIVYTARESIELTILFRSRGAQLAGQLCLPLGKLDRHLRAFLRQQWPIEGVLMVVQRRRVLGRLRRADRLPWHPGHQHGWARGPHLVFQVRFEGAFTELGASGVIASEVIFGVAG